jgi:hypothetical protein
MADPFTPMADLRAERAMAEACATQWGLELEPPFGFSNVSYVAPTTNGLVLKVWWGGDTQALHEPDALVLWDGDGAVRVLRQWGRALLTERSAGGGYLGAAR